MTDLDVTELNVTEWGSGDRVAVLLHGITNDSGSWWAVAPALVERGYRVLAPELPGHGLSPRTPSSYTPEAAADALVAAVPADVALLVGHSLGGRVAALAVDRIAPERAVYEDPAWESATAADGDYFVAQKHWTPADVAAHNPSWPEPAQKGKYAALQRWDPATVAALADFRTYLPERPTVPSLVVTAERNGIIGDARAAELTGLGFTVRMVPGAGHNVHNDDLEGFLKALDGWI